MGSTASIKQLEKAVLTYMCILFIMWLNIVVSIVTMKELHKAFFACSSTRSVSYTHLTLPTTPYV